MACMSKRASSTDHPDQGDSENHPLQSLASRVAQPKTPPLLVTQASLWQRLARALHSKPTPPTDKAGLPDALRDYRILAVLVGAAAVVALLSVPAIPRLLGPLGILAGLVYYAIASRRERRRRQLMAAPFPDAWREILQRRVQLYSQLAGDERRRFETEIQIFLGEHRIYALQGLPGQSGHHAGSNFAITDEHRVLIAASAATLLLGRPEWRLPTVRDIVVYPTAFAEETYSMDGHGHTIGMVHAQGPILFALDALESSFPTQHGVLAAAFPAFWSNHAQPRSPAHHVGIHEFAHVLDFIGAEGRAHGVPGLLSSGEARRWQQQLEHERQRLQVGQSVLSPYGLKNEAELFAVAVESFFEDASHLREHHPDLYALLCAFFNQDPAARAQHAQATPQAAPPHRPWFAMGQPIRYTA